MDISRGQIAGFDHITSFLFRGSGCTSQQLTAAYQSDNASRLKKQEYNDQEAVDQGVHIAAGYTSRGAAGGQERKLLDDAGQGEHESCSQDRAPDAGYATNDDGSDELDGECQVPGTGHDIASIGSEECPGDTGEK